MKMVIVALYVLRAVVAPPAVVHLCLRRQIRPGAQTTSDVSQQMAAMGAMDNLSLSDVPRDRLKRSASPFAQQAAQNREQR